MSLASDKGYFYPVSLLLNCRRRFVFKINIQMFQKFHKFLFHVTERRLPINLHVLEYELLPNWILYYSTMFSKNVI